MRLAIIPAVVVVGVLAPIARGQTWTWSGATNDWNTASNWNPASVPNSPSAAVIFGNGGTANIIISANAQAQSITFTGGNHALQGGTLSGLTTITVGSTATNTESVSTPLLFADTGPLTITNNSTVSLLDILSTIGTGGSGGLVVAGTGTVRLLGSFATSPNAVTGGLTMAGPGKFIMWGNGSNLAGGLTVTGGTLELNYSSNTATKLGSGGLTLSGGVLSIVANTSVPVTQTIPGGTLVTQRHTDIVGPSAGAAATTLALGAITRSASGTVDISPGAGSPTFAVTTTTGDTNGLVGTGPAFATFGGGSSWASAAGGTISGAIYGTDVYAPSVNTDVVAAQPPAGFTTNSLRFNPGSPSLMLSGANTLQSGGILVTPTAGPPAITGGSLTVPGGGELIIHQYGGGLTISTDLVAPGGVTTTGPGALTLSGNNGGLTGPINITSGSLTVTTPAAVNSAGSVNLNDDRPGAQQTIAFDFGTGSTGMVSAPIRLSASRTTVTTGASSAASLVLSGVISSAPGNSTPLYVSTDSANTGRVDLTNANMFTGDVVLVHGTLGIISDASLGDAANRLSLQVGSSAAGGLLFMNSGITIARPVSLALTTRLIVNGPDVVTITGSFAGTGGITKDGTGTLVIEGSKGATGLLTVAGGTLSLGTTGSLASVAGVTIASGATVNPATAAGTSGFGVLTLNGGVLRVTGGTNQTYNVNRIIANSPGLAIDFSAAGTDSIVFPSANLGITANASATFLGAANGTTMSFTAIGTVPITIAPGVTLTNGLGLSLTGPQTQALQLLGGGTLYQNSVANSGPSVTASVKVTFGRYRVTDVASAGGVGNLGTGTITLDGGTLAYGGPAAATVKPIIVTASGGTIEVEAGTTLTANGAFTGFGGLTKTGSGTLVLGNSGNSFTSLTVSGGAVQTANDAALGSGQLTVGALGSLAFTSTTTTSRSFNLNSSTLSVAAGQTLTFNGAVVGGGFLRGTGTFVVTGGTAVSGATAAGSVAVTVTGPASFANFSNGGGLTLAGGLAAPVAFDLFTNQGSGTVTVGAGSTLNASDFQTYGVMTLTPGTSFNTRTQITNVGTSQLYFNGGSRTSIGTPATAGSASAAVDLNGKDATVAGGLFVNNGIVFDNSTGNFQGPGRLVAGFGALVKGGGAYLVNVVTQNGGRFQAGNSPGRAAHAALVLGPSGLKNDTFQINNATATAGPTADGGGLVSGWTMHNVVAQIGSVSTPGDFAWTADATNPETLTLQSLLDPTPVGSDNFGPMANFDAGHDYSWPFVTWAGTYAGPTSDADLVAATAFDTTGFLNPTNGGTFGWHLDVPGQTLSLTFTAAVPEPGTLALTAAAGLASARAARRRRRPGS